jgi:hypothetical protein
VPNDRYHPQRPLWSPESGAEAIMPPTSGDETRSADDLTVTAHGNLLIAVLALPIALAAGVGDPLVAAAAVMTACGAARGSQVTYRRIRRLRQADDAARPPGSR